MHTLFHPSSSFRIFFFSAVLSIVILAWVLLALGWQAALVALMLVVIELTFSFDNAIVNAKILSTMSPFWQRMFMTVGIFIAVFGMRVIFPILIVMSTAGLSWNEVVDLALHNPNKYAEALHSAHPAIAAFGGMFLLMLTLHFFFDDTREIRWLNGIEEPLQYIGRKWLHAVTCIIILLAIVLLIGGTHAPAVLSAGIVGIAIYLIIHGASELFTIHHEKAEKKAGKTLQKVGVAGLVSFLYLEVLDASFSFDGVIGAFAITKDVVLIAAGLGIGALWVRSLTLFIVHKKVLHTYQYLEHGAHYVIGILAVTLLLGLFYEIPEVVAGLLGIGIIIAAIASSVKENKKVRA